MITSFIRKNCTSAIAVAKFQIITMKLLDDIHLQMLKLPIQKSLTAKVLLVLTSNDGIAERVRRLITSSLGRRFNTREGQTFLFFLLAMFILSFCFSTSAVFVIWHYSLTALTGIVLKYVSSYSNL